MAKYLREIKEHCTQLREVLLDAQLMTAAEIAPFWPGGENNPDRRAFSSWRYTLFNLARFSARAEARQEYRFGPNESRSEFLQQVQSGEPTMVPLLVPFERDGETISALPLPAKSWRALLRLATYGRIATLLLGAVSPLEEQFGISVDAPDLLVDAHEWRQRIVLQLVWGATAPGSALPWEPVAEHWPTLPAWLERIDGRDVLAIQQRFFEKHAQLLVALMPFVSAESKDADPLSGWETFFASYAIEKGIEAQAIMNDRAFAPFFTSLNLAAYAQRARRDEKKDAVPTTTVED